MLCTLYHDVKCTTSMLLLCDHSIYLTHAFHISCLLDAPRNFSNDFPQVRTAYCNVLGGSIQDGTLLHSKSQHTTVKHSRQLFEHTYTSDLTGTGTLTPTEFFQQDLLWQSSNTHSHSCSQKASKHTSGQFVGLSVHLHTMTAPRRIVHH
jgi:hypothetical protein